MTGHPKIFVTGQVTTAHNPNYYVFGYQESIFELQNTFAVTICRLIGKSGKYLVTHYLLEFGDMGVNYYVFGYQESIF